MQRQALTKFMAITIDTEPDSGPEWVTQRFWGFDSVIRGLPEVLQPIFANFAARPTYLLADEVIQNPECASVLRQLGDTCELGTHLHGDFVPPKEHPAGPPGYREFQCDYDVTVEKAKLEALTSHFEAAFGYKPVSFRAGRFGISSNTVPILTELGYWVDTSVVPGRVMATELTKVDFRRSPEQPYWPRADKPGRKGHTQILEVPVTICRHWVDRCPILRNRAKRLVRRLIRPHRAWWLRPSYSTADEMKLLIEKFVARYRRQHHLILNMMFHNVEVIPGASPYCQNKGDVEMWCERLEKTLSFWRSVGGEFCTLKELHEIFCRDGSK